MLLEDMLKMCQDQPVVVLVIVNHHLVQFNPKNHQIKNIMENKINGKIIMDHIMMNIIDFISLSLF